MRISTVIIYLLIFANFANAKSWYQHSGKWPQFDDRGNSIVKVSNEDLDPILKIIEKSSYKYLLDDALEMTSQYEVTELTDLVHACRFKSNLFLDERVATFGKNINNTQREHFLKALSYGDQLRLLNFDSFEERKEYIVRDFLRQSDLELKNYSTKLDSGIVTATKTSQQNKNIICLRAQNTVSQAANTLVHELIHFLYANHYSEYSLDDLKSFKQFEKKYLQSKGSEVEAFYHSCLFQLENKKSHPLSHLCKKSFISESKDFDKDVIYKNIKKHYTRNTSKVREIALSAKKDILSTKLKVVKKTLEKLKNYLDRLGDATLDQPATKFYKSQMLKLEKIKKELEQKILKINLALQS